MRTSARGLVKTASKAKKLQNFGKAWQVGDKGIAFYPIYKNEETGEMELLAAGAWGYRVNDMKALGLKASFIPSLSEIDENGRPVVQDIVSQFSRLAPVFIAGEKESRVRVLESKNWPNQAALKSALEKLDAEYDTANSLEAKRAVIGRLSLYISTEVLYVPIVNDVPQWQNARVYSQTLSNERISKLMAIIDDKQYGVQETDTCVEVQYDFIASDNKKATAGKAAPVGVTDAYKLKNRFPDKAEDLKRLIAELPDSTEVIENHNYSFNRISEADLKRAFTSYALFNSQYLDTIPEDREEQAVACAQIISDLEIMDSLSNQEFKDKLLEQLKDSESVTQPVIQQMQDSVPMPTEAPTLQGLMNNPNRASEADIDALALEDVNL